MKKASPKVVHMVPALFGPDGGIFGGAERYALELARNMAKQVPTTLLTFSDQPDRKFDGDLEIRVAGDPWFVRGQKNNPVSFSALWSAVHEADLIHCHQQHILSSSLAAALCRLTGRRVFVSDLGGGAADVSTYISTDRWYRGHLHISEYSRRISGHASRAWAHVIYGGADVDRFSPDPRVEKNGRVLFVGRLLAHKGVDDLVRAAPADMELEIVGRPYDPRYFADLEALAAGKRVFFSQGFDDAALVDAYRRSLCVVLPSVYRTMYGDETAVPELLGQTLLEGMACGLPAICTDVASMPELVEDGVTGFIVPPNNPDALREKLVWLRAHPKEAQTMGRAARQAVLERFTWSRVVERCLDIYSRN